MNNSIKKAASIFLAIILGFGSFVNSAAQTNIVAALDFDPKLNGYAFKNYRNEGEKWKDDINAEDLIRMFGVKAVCKTGDSAKNCVMKTAAQKWIAYYLEAMNIGHCEGIAVSSLRMNSGLPFKKKTSPANFQPGAKSPFNLRLDQPIENYIAYYWITQTFDEIKIPTEKTAERGPLEIVKTLIASMTDKKDTYLLGMFKYEKNRKFDGHAVAPFAVEELGNQYRIHVYDNNYPGETRYLFINKTGTQQWTYTADANPKAKPNYVGDLSTKTLSLTANSWREGKCFDASFARDSDKMVGCGIETSQLFQPFLTNASFQPARLASDADGEDAEFFLTGEGDMLVTDGDGNRIGYDPKTDRFYNEIPQGEAELLIGGLGLDLPQYTIPYEDTGNPYTVVFSGKHLTQESNLDFVFSAPGFTVGFDGIRLDPGETLTATISHDGEQITFTASADAETPEVFFAFDPEAETDASYITLIEGVELTAGKTLIYDFDFEKGKLFFSDDDGNEDEYDIRLIRLNGDGTIDEYEHNDVDIGKADKYEMDFGTWDGGDDTICFKDDEDSDGFDDEECTEESNEDTDEDSN